MEPDDFIAHAQPANVKKLSDGSRLVSCPVPTHGKGRGDRNPSLAVSAGRAGGVVLYCHAGCSTADVVAAVGLTLADLMNGDGKKPAAAPAPRSSGPRIAKTYKYTDESGRLLFEVIRYEPKDFRQRRPDGRGGWVWRLEDTRRVLYHLPEVLAAVAAGKPVFVVEGEKDVERLREAGAVATCNPHGAGKWKPEYSESLRGAHVTIVQDRDEPGRKHASAVAAALEGVAASVRVVEAKEGKDAADHLAHGYGLEEFTAVDGDPAPEPAATPAAEPEPAAECKCEPDDPPVLLYRVPELAALPEADVDWLLRGYLARGMLTQLTGLPKEGKSTFVAAAAAAVSEGRPFCGLPTTRTPVIYYTEEGRQTFLTMMRRLCAQDARDMHVLLRSAAYGYKWEEVCEYLRVWRDKLDAGLVVVDTFTDLSGLSGEEENTAGPVLKAIGHLRPVSSDGASVWTVRHDRKEGGTLVESGRGSGAFAGAVDVLMALRKRGDQREVLGIGRPEGVPDSMHVTFDGIDFAPVDDPRRQRDLAMERRILAVLPRTEEEAIGLEAVASLLECSTKTADKQLKRLREEGAVRSGRGKGSVTHKQAIGWWAP